MKQLVKYSIFKSLIFRRIILIFFDIAIILISFFTSILITQEFQNFNYLSHGILKILFTISLFIILYIISGQYRSLTRHMSSFGAYKIIIRNTFGIILITSLFYFTKNVYKHQ